MEIPFNQYLETLGIAALAEWDALAFVRRHGTTIASVANMVSLIGYSPSVIEAALDRLTNAELIQRSGWGGTGLYKFIPLDTPARQDCLEALIRMADRRNGRLQLVGALRKTDSSRA